MGAGRTLLIPVDRFLVQEARTSACRKEGIHHESRRRRWVRTRPDGARGRLRHARHLDDPRRDCRRRAHRDRCHCDCTTDLLRRGWKVGAVPAACLAPRRNGGANPCLRTHPCSNDGERGRLLGGAHEPTLCREPRSDACGCRNRHLHRNLRRINCVHADGYQARPCLLNTLATRLHVRRTRRWGVGPRHLSPNHARLLQGAPLPWIGFRDSRR